MKHAPAGFLLAGGPRIPAQVQAPDVLPQGEDGGGSDRQGVQAHPQKVLCQRRVRPQLSADAHLAAMPVRGLRRMADHPQNGGVAGITEALQPGILPVGGQGVLCQVVGADGEEVRLLRQLLRHHHGGRGFHHDAHLHRPCGNALGLQLGPAGLQQRFRLPNLPEGGDHGEHDGHRSEGRGPKDRPQLLPEKILPGQAGADSPAAQGGILLLIPAEAGEMFVRAGIQRADDRPPPGHGLHHLPVDGELLLLAGNAPGRQAEHLAAEEADALSAVVQRHGGVLNAAGVGVNPDFSPVQRNAGQIPQRPQAVRLPQGVRLPRPHGVQKIGVRVDAETAALSVQHRRPAVPPLVEVHPGEGGNAHGPGQDGRVAVFGSPAGNQPQQPGPVQGHRLAGGQASGGQNGGRALLGKRLPFAGEDIRYPAGNILYVGGPRAHIAVLHGGEKGGEALPRRYGGIGGADALGFQKIPCRLQIVIVLQQHLMDLKNGRAVPARPVQSLTVKFRQLSPGLAAGRRKAGPLLLRRKGGGPAELRLLPPADPQGTDGDPVLNGFSGCGFHSAASLQIVLKELFHGGETGLLISALHRHGYGFAAFDAQGHQGDEPGGGRGPAVCPDDGDGAGAGLGGLHQQPGGAGVDADGVGNGVGELLHDGTSFPDWPRSCGGAGTSGPHVTTL